jgi:prepilin-type N-terminal cleavage/methylation domain-containing protein
MKKPALARSVLRSKTGTVCTGFTLVELLTVLTVIGIISAISMPALKNLHCTCCLKAAIFEIAAMIREAKQDALAHNVYCAVTFNTTDGIVSLVTGRGADDKWNTPDDPVVRSFTLRQKGGGLRFSHGSYGPIKEPGKPPQEEAPDGVSFPTNNT